jgi:hypothetical protein
MNLDDFSYTENDRRYINPQVSLDEQNAFIDNLRNTQQTNTAQITQDTQNLGTELPSNLGGLGGGTSYFKARYQTPQTNSMVADLRATAQAQALGTLMSNEIAKAKKRYNDAYRAAKKRSNGGSGGNTNGNNLDKLTVDQTNDNNAGEKQTVKKYSVLNEAGEKVSVTADQLAELKRGAETNLRVWQDRQKKLNSQNAIERLFNVKSHENAREQVEHWQDTVNRLNNWEVTEE